MAETSDSSSTFTYIAAFLAVLITAAAGLMYLQNDSSGSGDGSRTAFAALSQAMPLHAGEVLSGDAEGLQRLDADLGQWRSLRGLVSAAPGKRSDWEQLTEGTEAFLARRDSLQAVIDAASVARQGMPGLLTASDELLGQSGATAAIQQFQQRGVALRRALADMLMSADQAAAATSIDANLTYMRGLLDALSGADSELDVAALPAAAIAATLTPLSADFSVIESSVRTALANTDSLAGLTTDVATLNAAARSIYTAAGRTSSTSSSLGVFASPLIWQGLLGVALLLILVLYVLHSKSAVYEITARVQAAQNDRNQQAILRLLDELGSLADGDLSVEATVTEDITGAIADSINYAIEKLRELVATINETAIMVDSAAKQTESMATHLSKASENQSREIVAATESIVSMAGSIEEVSGNAERSSDVARHSVDVAHKGGEAVRRTIDGMNTIRETIQDTSKRIKRLGESSQEIGNIVELINDIAEQTNILALNASIQASMAGEAGRGFAVVADEVQRLAERSTNATKQIEVLVRTIQADTNEAVVSMERSTTDVVGGALLAENAGAALDEIEQVSNQIANLVQNISGSARQQASSAADVTRRTSKLKEIGDQTSRATTATAASISKLSVLASQLRQTVAGFTLPKSALESSALASPMMAAPAPAPAPVPAAEGKAAV
jgi:twitching motility protein PilJ